DLPAVHPRLGRRRRPSRRRRCRGGGVRRRQRQGGVGRVGRVGRGGGGLLGGGGPPVLAGAVLAHGQPLVAQGVEDAVGVRGRVRGDPAAHAVARRRGEVAD